MSIVRRRLSGPTDDPGEFSDGSYEDEIQEGPAGESDYESADQSGSDLSERQSGDGQAKNSESERPVDDDEDRRNPQYIPKKGTFYEHDDRTVASSEDESTATNTVGSVTSGTTAEAIVGTPANGVGSDAMTPRSARGTPRPLKPRRSDDKWSHDKFSENDQAPKSRDELIAAYGYDIRKEDAPPLSRRRKRYSRGPGKYTRTWEDENAYGRTGTRQPSTPQTPPTPDQFPALKDEVRSFRRPSQGRQRSATVPVDHNTTPPAAIPEEPLIPPPRRSLPQEKPLGMAPHKKPFSAMQSASRPERKSPPPERTSANIKNTLTASSTASPAVKRIHNNLQVTVSPQSGQAQRQVVQVPLQLKHAPLTNANNNVPTTQQQQLQQPNNHPQQQQKHQAQSQQESRSGGKRYSSIIRQRASADNNFQTGPPQPSVQPRLHSAVPQTLHNAVPQTLHSTVTNTVPPPILHTSAPSLQATASQLVSQVLPTVPNMQTMPPPVQNIQSMGSVAVQPMQQPIQHRYLPAEYQQTPVVREAQPQQNAQHLMHQHRAAQQAAAVPATNVPPPQQTHGPSPPQILPQQMTSAPPPQLMAQRMMMDGQTMVVPHQHPHNIAAGLTATQAYVSQPIMPAQYMQANTGPVYAAAMYTQPPYTHQMYQQYVYTGTQGPQPPPAPTSLPPPPTRDITYYSAEQQQPVIDSVRTPRRPTAAIPILPPPPTTASIQNRPTPENDNIDRIVDNMFVKRQRPSPRYGPPSVAHAAAVTTTASSAIPQEVSRPSEKDTLQRITEDSNNVQHQKAQSSETNVTLWSESIEKGISDLQVKEEPTQKVQSPGVEISVSAVVFKEVGAGEPAVFRSNGVADNADVDSVPEVKMVAESAVEPRLIETSEA